MRPADDCNSMAELRAAIDELDETLVALLTKRATYIDRAVTLKTATGLPARIEARVDQVLKNVRTHAQAQALDPDLTEALWSTLVNWSIAREETVLGRTATLVGE
jgi:isochorismate pyruvate lyase